jgi:hypothetical protein
MIVIHVKSKSKRIRKVKSLIKSARNHIGSVWFHKRSDGTLRKLSYRLGVSNPTYCPPPTGKKFLTRKAQDSEHNLITVFDNNAIRYNNRQKMCGRGTYKSIPLDGVTRIKVGGEIYKIIA